ncbi:hypothetical protein SAMN02910369_00189 [Lachnospiraceae bacterium NE2001]|nr:hypothetical protein SAMN02910369_00189 [Lachnospiraceae bacterium NE2001]
MSKYISLWKWIQKNGDDKISLTYAEIEKISGLPIDHSFLTYKKELIEYGYKVGKISMKEQKVMFEKVGEDENKDVLSSEELD